MSDFSNTKKFGTATYPVHALATSGLLRRCEPFLIPEQLVSRFLKGISLKFKNGDSFSSDDLKDRINLAMNEAELLIGTVITRESFQQKAPFDSSLYKSFVHTMVEHRPIISVERLSIVTSSGTTIFELPSTWIEASNFSKGLINVVPLLSTFSGSQGGSSGSGVGVAFLSTISNFSFVPAYWQINYTAGLSNKEGSVPTPVNELIGTIAAIAILSEIAPLNVFNSQSQSQDNISQSSSGPGNRLYLVRIEELEKKKDDLVKKLKGIFSTRLLVGSF